MLTEITCFETWLKRRHPHSSTPLHYTSDVRLFFNWLDVSPSAVTVQDIDCTHCLCVANVIQCQ